MRKKEKRYLLEMYMKIIEILTYLLQSAKTYLCVTYERKNLNPQQCISAYLTPVSNVKIGQNIYERKKIKIAKKYLLQKVRGKITFTA